MDATPRDPVTDDIARRTDAYFTRTREVVQRFGDKEVTYALFLRRPVISAPAALLDWLGELGTATGAEVTYGLRFAEGEWVGAGEPILTVTGPFCAAVGPPATKVRP